MTDSFIQFLESIGMTEAEWEARREEINRNVIEFCKTLDDIRKNPSYSKIKYGNN